MPALFVESNVRVQSGHADVDAWFAVDMIRIDLTKFAFVLDIPVEFDHVNMMVFAPHEKNSNVYSFAIDAGELKATRASNAFARAAQPSIWSLTSPIACMNAYILVGPTKVQPRFLRSLDKAMDSGEVVTPLIV